MRHAIAVEGLTKRFRAAVVVRDVSFAVAPGEIVGLLGPNGAGKTTTIQMLLGIIRPTAGRIEILGLDLARERAQVESNKMRYFNIPVTGASPRVEQADEFLRLTRDKSNHPMLINCASANRVGAFMMILRVVDQGWSEDKALDEAIKIGLSSDGLKKFAKEYIATHPPKRP